MSTVMIPHSAENVGYLELVVGPMYSGKTSRLLSLHKQFNLCNISNALVNHTLACNGSPTVTNHDDGKSTAIQGETMYGILPMNSDAFRKTKVFLVNEAQFFPDICDWCKEAVSSPFNKSVYLVGLDGDYRREAFGNWLSLIPFADQVEKLRAICMRCKIQSAPFTRRVDTENVSQVLVSDSHHMPLCRKCYDEN